MDNFQKDIDDRANLTQSNRFELLLFRLGTSLNENKSELFGINVFKLREIVPMPEFTKPAGMKSPLMGMVNIRDQVIPVIDLAAVARSWRGGCIIRAKFLNRISDAFESGEANVSLLFAPYFKDAIETAQRSWRRVVSRAISFGVPVPVFASSLEYFDGLRSDRLPAALIQGQRDYFGAHTYQRTDMPGAFHTLWAEPGREEIIA